MLATLAIVAMLVTFAVSASLERAADERARGAVQEARAMLGQARAEALRRNVACRFAIDTTTRDMQVIDTRDTAGSSDDVVLAVFRLDHLVTFAAPDGSTAITFPLAGASTTVHAVDFAATGRVSGIGQMAVQCGSSFARVTVAGGGGLRTERWAGGTWMED